MPVMHSDNSVPTPPAARRSSLEDVLREAATFAETAEVPEGLAYRALAPQIAAQEARAPRGESKSQDRKRALCWLGGLSAGTLAGASAAILLMAHLNGAIFNIAPEAVPSPSSPGPVLRNGFPASAAAPETAAASVVKASAKQTAPGGERPEVPPATRPTISRKERMRPVQTANTRQHATELKTSTARIESPLPAPGENAEPAATAQWKTETVDETAYQLVTTAYVAAPENGNGSAPENNGDRRLTPVRMCIDLEPTVETNEPLSAETN